MSHPSGASSGFPTPVSMSPRGHRVLQNSILTRSKRRNKSNSEALDKVITMLNAFKSEPLGSHLLMFGVRSDGNAENPSLRSEARWLTRASLSHNGRAVSWTCYLFTEHHFHLEEQLTDKLWLLRLGCLADSLWKRNKWARHSRKTTDNICCQCRESNF